MAKVACPYCYHRFSAGSLRFQCTGRPAPGREKCAKSVDPERQRLTGFSGMAGPTFEALGRFGRSPRKADCPDCGTSSGIRACPVCHTPLPANFADGESPLIGVVGGKNAGKTVYTTVLVHELRNNIRRRFDADISFAGEQAGVGTAQWLERYEQALFDDQSLFESTTSSADGIRTPLVVQWRQPRVQLGRRVHRTTTLSFYDAAGEDMTSQEFVNSQAYLTSADGLIVLLDPFQLPGAADRIAVPDAGRRDAEPPIGVLNRVTEMLRSSTGLGDGKQLRTPIAVVFSKIDAFFGMLGADHPLLSPPRTGPEYDETAGQNTDEHLRALLAELGADDVDAHLRAHYRTFRYFAVSALGAEPDYRSKQIDPAGVRPFRVDEPLLWLLSNFKVIDRSRA
ncbi:zinc ribbon domain-containing protein [Saccharopolyspora sp. NPDC002686]|uniref:TRAFAC clade GTPase domain-containing protein n=1 Tax=Saccharopolyspora sp. NPDC002686 TaxID=3154541 RepID=UPI00331CFC7C